MPEATAAAADASSDGRQARHHERDHVVPAFGGVDMTALSQRYPPAQVSGTDIGRSTHSSASTPSQSDGPPAQTPGPTRDAASASSAGAAACAEAREGVQAATSAENKLSPTTVTTAANFAEAANSGHGAADGGGREAQAESSPALRTEVDSGGPSHSERPATTAQAAGSGSQAVARSKSETPIEGSAPAQHQSSASGEVEKGASACADAASGLEDSPGGPVTDASVEPSPRRLAALKSSTLNMRKLSASECTGRMSYSPAPCAQLNHVCSAAAAIDCLPGKR